MTTSDLPAEGQPDVSSEGTEAPFDDVITLSTSTGDDGVVTVTVVGEVDTFTAPVLRSTLDSQLEQDLDTTPPTDSGTERTADDIEATADAPIGGEGPEESAVHITGG